MSDILLTKSAHNPALAEVVQKHFSPLVVNLTALSVDGKQAHWHVRGVNFLTIHEFLDVIVDHARALTDLVAERIVALGAPVDARIQTVGKETGTSEMVSGFTSSNEVIQAMIDQIDVCLDSAKAAQDAFADEDPTSEDIAIEVIRQLEQDRWFLFAHIVE